MAKAKTQGFTIKASSDSKAKSDAPTYEVLEEIGTLGKRGAWEVKVRYMSWNGKEPKYDIRTWKEDEDGEKCGKGIGLSGEELLVLRDLLNEAEQE